MSHKLSSKDANSLSYINALLDFGEHNIDEIDEEYVQWRKTGVLVGQFDEMPLPRLVEYYFYKRYIDKDFDFDSGFGFLGTGDIRWAMKFSLYALGKRIVSYNCPGFSFSQMGHVFKPVVKRILIFWS